MQRNYHFLDLVMVLFVTVLLVSNIASSAKIVDWGVSLFGLPLAFDAGTLLFPISYIFGDVLTEVYGYRRSRRVIWAGFGSLALAGSVFWLVGRMPGEATWQSYAGQEAYNAILGGMSSGGIIVASLTAYFAGEFSNSYTLAKMKILTRGRWLWTRTIGSTLIGEGVDTVFFVTIACAFGVFPWSVALSIITANYIFKVGIEALATPITYRVVSLLKRLENEDYYDYDTDFNPFKVTT
ncbi:MAG TPA: VUT family protein [Anaerolineae bacterium]|nr:VUT family protein [Anaerolineae bacterium]HIQ04130.1 VUT family protein [Anaerolineae bacterium]